jgi:hypothetical protein
MRGAAVIEFLMKEYGTQLPYSYLREPRTGRNCALDKALRECRIRLPREWSNPNASSSDPYAQIS